MTFGFATLVPSPPRHLFLSLRKQRSGFDAIDADISRGAARARLLSAARRRVGQSGERIKYY